MLAQALRRKGISYLVLELDPAIVSRAAAEGESIFFGDSTKADILEKAGLRRARALVFAISDPFVVPRAVATTHALNPGLTTIVRTARMEHVTALELDVSYPRAQYPAGCQYRFLGFVDTTRLAAIQYVVVDPAFGEAYACQLPCDAVAVEQLKLKSATVDVGLRRPGQCVIHVVVPEFHVGQCRVGDPKSLKGLRGGLGEATRLAVEEDVVLNPAAS